MKSIKKALAVLTKEKVLKALESGERQSEVAARLGYSRQYVHAVAREAGLSKPQSVRREESKKKKEEEAQRIRRLVESHPNRDEAVQAVADSLKISIIKVQKALGISTISRHGGRRPGAGRKPSTKEKKVRLGATITESQYQMLIAAGDGSLIRGVEAALECFKLKIES